MKYRCLVALGVLGMAAGLTMAQKPAAAAEPALVLPPLVAASPKDEAPAGVPTHAAAQEKKEPAAANGTGPPAPATGSVAAAPPISFSVQPSANRMWFTGEYLMWWVPGSRL